MDLSTIHKKITNLEYLDADGFIKDIELMVTNCHSFCTGKFDELIPLADKLLEYSIEEVSKVESLLEEIKNAPTTTPTVRSNEKLLPPKKKKKQNLTIDTSTSLIGEESTPTSSETPIIDTPNKEEIIIE